MRFTTITFTAFASLAFGQSQGGLNLPACATGCVTDFTNGSQLGGCDLINITCICEKKAFLDSIACCLAERCSIADQEQAAKEALGFCALVGATGLPTAVVCSSTSGASSRTASTTPTGTITSATSSGTITAPPSSTATNAAAASASTARTSNGALQNVAGVGAGVFGAFAAALL